MFTLDTSTSAWDGIGWIQVALFSKRTSGGQVTTQARVWSSVVNSGWVAGRGMINFEQDVAGVIVPIGKPVSAAGVDKLLFATTYTGIEGTITPTFVYRTFDTGDITRPNAWSTGSAETGVSGDTRESYQIDTTTTDKMMVQAGVKYTTTESFTGIANFTVLATKYCGDGRDCGGGCGDGAAMAQQGSGATRMFGHAEILAPNWDNALEGRWVDPYTGEESQGYEATATAGALHGLGGFGPQAAMAAGAGGGAGGPDIGQWDNPNATVTPPPQTGGGGPDIGAGGNPGAVRRAPCYLPTIQPFADWPSKDCFPTGGAHKYDVARKLNCCEDAGGLDMRITLPCEEVSEEEKDILRQFFSIDWSGSPLTLPNEREVWEEIFIAAWAIALTNLDLLKWTMCYYSELLNPPGGDSPDTWPEMFDCVYEKLTSLAGQPRHAVMVAGSPDIVAPIIKMVNGVPTIEWVDSDPYLSAPFQPEGPGVINFFPSVTSETYKILFVPWQAASQNIPFKLCVALEAASVIIHELMHSCGEAHPPRDGEDCEFQWIVQSSWFAGVSERFGGCLNATCCGSNIFSGGVALGSPQAWGIATRPPHTTGDAGCLAP